MKNKPTKSAAKSRKKSRPANEPAAPASLNSTVPHSPTPLERAEDELRRRQSAGDINPMGKTVLSASAAAPNRSNAIITQDGATLHVFLAIESRYGVLKPLLKDEGFTVRDASPDNCVMHLVATHASTAEAAVHLTQLTMP